MLLRLLSWHLMSLWPLALRLDAFLWRQARMGENRRKRKQRTTKKKKCFKRRKNYWKAIVLLTRWESFYQRMCMYIILVSIHKLIRDSCNSVCTCYLCFPEHHNELLTLQHVRKLYHPQRNGPPINKSPTSDTTTICGIQFISPANQP